MNKLISYYFALLTVAFSNVPTIQAWSFDTIGSDIGNFLGKCKTKISSAVKGISSLNETTNKLKNDINAKKLPEATCNNLIVEWEAKDPTDNSIKKITIIADTKNYIVKSYIDDKLIDEEGCTLVSFKDKNQKEYSYPIVTPGNFSKLPQPAIGTPQKTTYVFGTINKKHIIITRTLNTNGKTTETISEESTENEIKKVINLFIKN